MFHHRTTLTDRTARRPRIAAVVAALALMASLSAARGAHAAGAGFWHTSGSAILDQNGQQVRIAGVNWFGMETSNFAPHGLWTRGYKDMMDQMVDLGFNTIRLPFASEMLHTTAAPNGIDFSKSSRRS